jgi:hypothetical protein
MPKVPDLVTGPAKVLLESLASLCGLTKLNLEIFGQILGSIGSLVCVFSPTRRLVRPLSLVVRSRFSGLGTLIQYNYVHV